MTETECKSHRPRQPAIYTCVNLTHEVEFVQASHIGCEDQLPVNGAHLDQTAGLVSNFDHHPLTWDLSDFVVANYGCVLAKLVTQDAC